MQTEKILRNEGIVVTLFFYDKNDIEQKAIARKGILSFRNSEINNLKFDLTAPGKTFTMSFKFADISIMGIGSGDGCLQDASNHNDHDMYIVLQESSSCAVLRFEGTFLRDKMFVSLLVLVSNALGKFDPPNISDGRHTFLHNNYRCSNKLNCSEEHLY